MVLTVAGLWCQECLLLADDPARSGGFCGSMFRARMTSRSWLLTARSVLTGSSAWAAVWTQTEATPR